MSYLHIQILYQRAKLYILITTSSLYALLSCFSLRRCAHLECYQML